MSKEEKIHRLINKYWPAIWKEAYGLSRVTRMDRDDAAQEIVMSLLRFYDPERGPIVDFIRSYSRRHVRDESNGKDLIRNPRRKNTVPQPGSISGKAIDTYHEGRERDPAQITETRDLARNIEKILGERNATILWAYCKGDTMKMVGKEHGLSEQRISQIIIESIDRLKECFNDSH